MSESAANGLAHEAAHDALSDVRATIALARLIKSRQPRLWDFCLKLREAGYRNVWTPFAELVHHESATRGRDESGFSRFCGGRVGGHDQMAAAERFAGNCRAEIHCVPQGDDCNVAKVYLLLA